MNWENEICSSETLALVGMCKNAGKTTALNYCLHILNKRGMKLGLTSIGRDGESSDLVTGTYKPPIYVRKGTLVATAAGMLKNCDITKEILDTTGISTPVGEVVLCRALSDGYLDLAGPSTNQQLIEINRCFRRFGADKILIDGAISRKSLCAPEVAESALLCTGASYDKSMEITIRDTAYVEELFLLKEVGKTQRELQEISCEVPSGERVSAYMLNRQSGKMTYFFLNGALTDVGVQELFLSFSDVRGKIIVVRDCSKILLTSAAYEKLKKKGVAVQVQHSARLVGVTMNPYSAYGNHYDALRFEEQLKERLISPVLNVRRMEE